MDGVCACGRKVEGVLDRHVPACEVCRGIPDTDADEELIAAMRRVRDQGGDLKEFRKDLDRRLDEVMVESMMTLRVGVRTHDIKYYNDDNGHGLTYCGRRVYPWSVTKAGGFDCKACRKGRKKLAKS